MSHLMQGLHQKRQRLIAESAQQRHEISQALVALKMPIALIDTTLSLTHIIRQHLWLVLGATFVLGRFHWASFSKGAHYLRKLWAGWSKFRTFIHRPS